MTGSCPCVLVQARTRSVLRIIHFILGRLRFGGNLGNIAPLQLGEEFLAARRLGEGNENGRRSARPTIGVVLARAVCCANAGFHGFRPVIFWTSVSKRGSPRSSSSSGSPGRRKR